MSGARAFGLLVGWVADELVGDPRRGHPVAVYGAVAAAAERRWHADERAQGAAYTVVLVAVPALTAAVANRRLSARADPVPWAGTAALTAALTWVALGGRSLAREAGRVADALESADLDEARRRLPALVGRDPSALDEKEICRAVVESVAENTADAVTGPLLWGALAGPGGIVAHRCANTLDAMVGHRSARHERFGWASAWLDDALGWLPARITALLAAACAPLVGGSPRAALDTWRRDAHRHPSPNAGPCEAAFAGALGVRLGGQNRYGERVETRGPLGDGPPPGVADVRRAVTLSRAVSAAAAVLAAAVAARSTGTRRVGGAR